MTYKRIIEILDPNTVVATDAAASHLGWVFRAVRTGGNNEYVIEGPDTDRAKINRLVVASTYIDS
jgi:hypothetical protein